MDGERTALALLLMGLMAERGMSVAQLVERSGMPQSTVYSYLRGRARGDKPRPGTFEAFARALDVSPELIYAAAARSDARGERRLIGHYRRIRTEAERAEAIEAVRRIAHRIPDLGHEDPGCN